MTTKNHTFMISPGSFHQCGMTVHHPRNKREKHAIYYPSRHGGTTEDVSATTAKSTKGGGNPLTASMVRFQKPESLLSQEALDRYCLSEINNTL